MIQLLLLPLLGSAFAATTHQVSSKDAVVGKPTGLAGNLDITVGATTCAPADGAFKACNPIWHQLGKAPVAVAQAGADHVLEWASAASAGEGSAKLNPVTGVVTLPAAAPTEDAVLAVPNVGFYPLKRKAGRWESDDKAFLGALEQFAGACSTTAPGDADCTVRVRGFDGAKEGPEWRIDLGRAADEPVVDEGGPDDDTVDDTPTCSDMVRTPYAFAETRLALCVDLTGDRVAEQSNIPDRILLPNQAFTVFVRHAAGEDVSVAASGSRGLTEGEYDAPAAAIEAHSGKKGSTGTVVTQLTFAARKPGTSVDVTVTRAGKVARVSELEVAPVYIGAVRMGVAAGSVVDQSYGIATAPGSGQGEIIATSGSSLAWQPELVVGFAPFVFTPRGRPYVGERTISARYLAPYVALGVASLDEEATVKFSLLKSVYLGLEYELGRNASLGVAAQLREVTRLADPYQVGGPIDGSTVPTVTAYTPGVAVFFNVSPDFLRVVKPLAK